MLYNHIVRYLSFNATTFFSEFISKNIFIINSIFNVLVMSSSTLSVGFILFYII